MHHFYTDIFKKVGILKKHPSLNTHRNIFSHVLKNNSFDNFTSEIIFPGEFNLDCPRFN